MNALRPFASLSLNNPSQITSYKPLISYDTWQLIRSDDYVTDGVELTNLDLTTWDFSTGQDSVQIDSNSFAYIPDWSLATETPRLINNNNGLYFKAGNTYMVKIDAVAGTAGRVSFYAYAQNIGEVHGYESGEKTFTFTADTNGYLQTLWYTMDGAEYDGRIKIKSIQKVIQEPSKRYAVDKGTSPKYPLALHSGQGVKFNGIDQCVSGGTWNDIGITTNPTGFTISCFVSGGTRQIWNTGYESSYNGIGLVKVNATTYRVNSNSTENSPLTFTFQDTGVITLTWNDGLVSMYGNGELLATQQFIYTTPFLFSVYEVLSIGAYRLSSSYFSGIINNVIVVDDGVLTPEQIAYQYNNPERFLYREDNVLKSAILTQSEIDNVVAYLPMCEKDNYVRDLVGYSEGVELNTYSSFIPAGTQTLNGTEITFNGQPNSNIRVSVPSQTDGTLYKISLDVTSYTSGYLEYNLCGNNRSVDSISGVGSFSFVTNSVGDSNFLFYLQEDSTIGFNGVVDNLSIKQLSGIYPIEEATSECRDDAQNLQYGLQTSKLARDSLGVPTALSDYFECDDVAYGNTGKSFDNTKDFVIYGVVKFDDIGAEQAHGTAYNGATTRVTIGSSGDGRILARLGSETKATVGVGDAFTPFFFCIKRIDATDTMQFKINDVQIGSDSVSTFTESMEWVFGRQGIYSTYKSSGEVRMWETDNILTTDEYDTKEYNKAVSKGLLT
ncbi:hypothetical protein TPMD03_49 [Thiohalocapsa phage LS06-2018-MD03]|nr:hypothetical protein TPMD03_49 [Thiohalocapsa phage LS06-2018-MD03]